MLFLKTCLSFMVLASKKLHYNITVCLFVAFICLFLLSSTGEIEVSGILLSRGNWKYRWWSFKWWRQKPPASNPFFSFWNCYRIALQKARTWNYIRELTVCKLQIVSNIHWRFQSESWTSSLMMTEHCISDNMATIKTCQTATSSTIIPGNSS